MYGAARPVAFRTHLAHVTHTRLEQPQPGRNKKVARKPLGMEMTRVRNFRGNPGSIPLQSKTGLCCSNCGVGHLLRATHHR